MKFFFILISLALGSFVSQAQTTLCDYIYTTGNYFVFEVAIPTTGNGLPNMAPLYAITYTSQDTWEDSCFGGPCTHTVFNEYNEDTITTCISYTLTDQLGNVDTSSCCVSQIWDSETMQWIVESPEMNCELLDILVSSSSETSISMTSNTEFYMDPALGPFTYLWNGYTTSGDFITMSSSETLSTYLDDEIYLSDSVVICFEVSANNEETCEICDTLFYNGPINGWISVNNPDQATDLDCDLIEIEIASQNDEYIEMTSNAMEMDGVLSYNWITNDEYSNTFYFNQNMVYDTIVSCMTIIDQYDESCEVCETIILTDNGWVLESEITVDPNDSLFNICDSLNVFISNSSENSVNLSTNLESLISSLETSFSWQSWGDYLNVEVVEGQNAFFDLPNNVESFYFLLQVVISNEQVEASDVLCIYPFLIEWDSLNYVWQANSLTMSQMPSSVDYYSPSNERKLIKIVDALGRENQENKSMILFYIYDDGKIEKKFILE